MTTTVRSTSAWYLNPPPDDDSAVLLCFPYAGTGASCYRDWPKRLGAAAVCALQPPGRENRFREQAPPDHRTYARQLAPVIAELTAGGRAVSLFGHCGGVPYALRTLQELADRGDTLPRRLVASSWGAPQRGLYGPLNHVDIATHDLAAEVRHTFAVTGQPEPPAMLVEMAADVLRADLEFQRPYRYDPARRVPVPVTVVSWSGDVVVPPEEVDDGWSEVAVTEHVRLDGEHFDFLRCPAPLRELLGSLS